MKYFRVNIDFTNFISIDETELEKAIYAFRLQVPVVFKEGATDHIRNIIPDYWRMNRWNPTWKLGDDDYTEINRSEDCFEAKKLFELQDKKVTFLIETKQQHLIGKNAKVSLPEKPKELVDGTQKIVDKMKIK